MMDGSWWVGAWWGSGAEGGCGAEVMETDETYGAGFFSVEHLGQGLDTDYGGDFVDQGLGVAGIGAAGAQLRELGPQAGMR